MSDDPLTECLRQFKDPPVTSEQANHHWSFLKSLVPRIDEAQQRLNAAKDGDVVQIDLDLMPYINRTEK